MHNPLVSVVMVNYNHQDFLRDAIQSVVDQTYKNWELIVVDDGSTDASVDIIKSFNDERIKPILLEENGHICKATNCGLEQVQGEYVARLDSDDIWAKNKLELQVKFFKDNPEAMTCFTKLDIIDEQNHIINDTMKDLYSLYNYRQTDRNAWLRFFFFVGNSLIQSTMMYKKEILDEIGYFNLAYVQSHDLDFFVRISKKYDFHFIEEPLCGYRRTEKQNSATTPENDIRFFNEHMSIRNHFFDDMSDHLFIEVFGDCFVFNKTHSKEELEVEKAFILSKCIGFSDANPVLGMALFEKYLNDSKMLDILEKEFDFYPKNYYEMNTKIQYSNSDDISKKIKKLESEIKILEKTIDDQQDHINTLLELKDSQQKVIEDMQASASWKITKPLRSIKKLTQ